MGGYNHEVKIDEMRARVIIEIEYGIEKQHTE